jgi:hypothetical protein
LQKKSKEKEICQKKGGLGCPEQALKKVGEGTDRGVDKGRICELALKGFCFGQRVGHGDQALNVSLCRPPLSGSDSRCKDSWWEGIFPYC